MRALRLTLLLFVSVITIEVVNGQGFVGGLISRLFGASEERLADGNECKTVSTQEDFVLEDFIAKPWYIQQQMITQYLPATQNYCVRAEYQVLPESSWRRFWGYTIQVHNVAQNAEGGVQDSGMTLCASADDSGDPAKLQVAPCFLPRNFAGPYWVIAYNSTEGYALVSGGQPTVKTDNGCKTGDGMNDSGLWIFTNKQGRDEKILEKVRNIASDQGYDLSVLNDVNQADCPNSEGDDDGIVREF